MCVCGLVASNERITIRKSVTGNVVHDVVTSSYEMLYSKPVTDDVSFGLCIVDSV